MQSINNKMNNQTIAFKSLQEISKKAYKVGGQALRDSIPDLSKLAHDRRQDIYIIPKNGFISKVKSLIFFVTDEGKQTGRWFSLSKDPKKILPDKTNNSVFGYLTVGNFTKENITNAAKSASDKQDKKKAFETGMSSVKTPADLAYIILKSMKAVSKIKSIFTI